MIPVPTQPHIYVNIKKQVELQVKQFARFCCNEGPRSSSSSPNPPNDPAMGALAISPPTSSVSMDYELCEVYHELSGLMSTVLDAGSRIDKLMKKVEEMSKGVQRHHR